MSLAYLNGEFLPMEQARMPVMDRGFLFGDGVYEVSSRYSRRSRSGSTSTWRACRKASPASASPIRTAADEWKSLIPAASSPAPTRGTTRAFYLQVTRGPMAVRNHAFPQTATPTVFAMTEPLVTPSPELRATGATAVSAADFRWLRCDIKATSLLANCLLRQLAVNAGCAETVLLRDGFLTEGAASTSSSSRPAACWRRRRTT